MNTTKYVLFAALGVAAVLLLTSDKAREFREDLEDSAMENAKKWKGKLAKMGNSTSDTIADLKDMLGSEISGLSGDARKRLENIVEGTAKNSSRLKKNLSKQLS